MHAFNDNTDCYRYTHSPTLSAACVSEAIDWTEKQKVLGVDPEMDRGIKIESVKAQQVYLVPPKDEPLKEYKIT